MAKVDKNTGKVTVQKGDTAASIAKAVAAATGQKVTTAQINQAISANKTLAARQKAGSTVLFSGTTFKVPGITAAGPTPSGNAPISKTVINTVTNDDGSVTISYSDGTSETKGGGRATLPDPADAMREEGRRSAFAILDSYLATGSAESENAIALLAHTASYTLLPTEAYDTYYLDIGVSGYWEDYLPLSYFGQFVTNEDGGSYYDLDFIQFNIGYPKPSKLLEGEETSSWTYNDLFQEYGHPVQRTYESLDNYLFTGWNNYEDMESRSIKFYEYDTSEASIRSYLTFQYITEGANSPQSAFTHIEPPKEGSIIDIADYTNWDVTKFEVVDNTLVYPNKSVDFNELAIVYHLEFNIRGILTKPITLRRLELASQAFNDNSFNPVGTRFGVDLFPYTRAGLYYDYKSKNPFSIYKGSTPYLYLNRTSGIEIRGQYDPLKSRGIAIPINRTLSDNYRVSAMQVWMRSDLDKFPLVETELNVEVGGVLMKGFLDRLMVSPEGELTVIDIKTSKNEPASHTQLGTYAVMCEKTIGVRPTKGAYFMARTGELTTPVDLEHYTESRLGSHLRGFKIAVDNNIFIPQPGFMCGTCSVNHACYAVKGIDSHKYPELGETNE